MNNKIDHWKRVTLASSAIFLVASGCGIGEPGFVKGSASLPSCDEKPSTTALSGDWYDNGTVTIKSSGCFDTEADDSFVSCGLDWKFTQDGNSVEIVVDEEYRIDARLCGDQLYLSGGWWLPVKIDGICDYDDESADEVGIEEGGNVLTVSDGEITGTLSLKGSCDAEYEVIFAKK